MDASSYSLEFITTLQNFIDVSLDDHLMPRQNETAMQCAWNFAQNCARTVPAYGAVINQHGIAVSDLDARSFKNLPILTRENYVERFALADRCENGDIHACNMAAVSSGTTGTPTVWPRTASNELHVARRFEQVFRDSFAANSKSTLAVVCFAMGTWVGGLYTLDCCRYLALKGLKVFTVAPGSNLNEILRIVGEMSPKFEQTVLLGYPPFLKDVIDEGISRQVPWSDHHVRWVCAGEVFSEEWRALVASRLGTPDDCTSSASIYGTADAGVLACETPLSISIRRWLAKQPEAATRLFGESRLPALLQYDPYHRFFECIDGELLFTGDNGVPLVRYNIHDTGGIMEYDEMLAQLQGYGFDALTSPGMFNLPVRKLPFVWVFGRSNFTISYYGANIYPENVTVALEQEPLCNWVTGKFVMHVGHDTDENSRWMVEIELAQEAEATPDKVVEIQYAIQSQLIRLNSEFAHYVPSAAKLPTVNLHPYHDATWFPAGVKHRYTRR